MKRHCPECGNAFNKPNRGKGATGPKPIHCPSCRKKIRKKKAADNRYRERQQFKFARGFITEMAEADAAGQLARWLTTIDLQAVARKCSKEGLTEFELS